jgi:hypothetical protein
MVGEVAGAWWEYAFNQQEAYKSDSTDHLFFSASRPLICSGGQCGRMEKFLVLG